MENNHESVSSKITYDILYDLYFVQNLTQDKIGEMYGVSRGLIKKLMRKYGMSKSQKIPTQEELYQLYVIQNKSESSIGEIYGKNRATVGWWLRKYGIEKSLDQVLESKKHTNFERYGTTCPLQNEEIVAKRKASCIEKYGVEHPMQSESVKLIVRTTMKDRYGCNHNSQLHLAQNSLQTVSSQDELLNYIHLNGIKTTRDLMDSLGYSKTQVNKILHKFDLYDLLDHNESSPEQEVRDFIASLGVESSRDRQILSGKEIDIYCPDYKIGIEFNGIYWHSSLYKDRNYHYNKSLEAEKQGIRLIHIFENEWEDERTQPIIKSLLRLAFGKIPHRLYARQCEVREISNADAKDFVNRNHLQGHRNAKVTLGLFNGEELVQVMSFSHNKDYEWEIIRSCPKMDTSVVGGISKLYQYFKKTYHPTEIFSYADFNKFDGNGYAALGMELIGYTGPDMKWIIDGEVYNRNPGKNAEMRERAEAQLFGAGSKKFLWKA